MFADSFFINKDKVINITKNIPTLQSFYSSSQHHIHTEETLLVEKVITCERIGDKQFYYSDISGIYFAQDNYKNLLTSQCLKGKLAVYEHALIFEDAWLQCFVAEFKNIERVNTYLGEETWMEFILNENSGLPLNTCFESKFILNMKDLYYSKNIKWLRDILKDKLTTISEDFKTDDLQYLSAL